MANLENEVQRSARDIPDSISSVLATKLTAAVQEGEIRIEESELRKLLVFLEQNCKQAGQGALKTFYVKFEELQALKKTVENADPKD